jgi:hypothetical protein
VVVRGRIVVRWFVVKKLMVPRRPGNRTWGGSYRNCWSPTVTVQLVWLGKPRPSSMQGSSRSLLGDDGAALNYIKSSGPSSAAATTSLGARLPLVWSGLCTAVTAVQSAWCMKNDMSPLIPRSYTTTYIRDKTTCTCTAYRPIAARGGRQKLVVSTSWTEKGRYRGLQMSRLPAGTRHEPRDIA